VAENDDSSLTFDQSRSIGTRRSGLSSLAGARLQHRLIRYGVALRSVLMFACGAGALIGAAAILDPVSLIAVSNPDASGQPPRAKSQHSHREFLASMAKLITGCVEVLAVHDRTASPYAEIVLWMDDHVNQGVIDADELAIVSHSSLLRAVTVYSMNGHQPNAAVATGNGDGFSRSAIPPLDRETVSQPAFCDRWRALAVVRPHVIAQGISDMRVDRHPGSSGELSLLRLSLTWAADSTDGASEVSTLLDLSRRRQGGQE
jgi:hypothetical protein